MQIYERIESKNLPRADAIKLDSSLVTEMQISNRPQ